MSELQLHRVGLEDRGAVVADVIFVHGLNGSSAGTWQCGGDVSTFWPLWLFEDVPEIMVWTLDYPADTFTWSSASGADMVLPDRGRSIIDLLVSHGIGSRPIIFVAYSLGGLIVKQILRLAVEMGKAEWQELGANTRGVLFLATPHTGAGLGSIAKAISVFGIAAKAVELTDNNPYLLDLNDWYQQKARARGYKTHAYCEMKKTNGFLVVDQASANPGIEGCLTIPFDGNHLEICKPASRSSPIYVGTRRFVDSIVGEAAGKTEAHEVSVAPVSVKVRLADAVEKATNRDGLSAEALNEFEFFTKQIEEDERLDLAEKLRRGGRGYEIQRAVRLKEQFAKRFARNQLQPSVTQRYIKILAEVDSRFNAHVFPKIAEAASRAEIADLIRNKVTEPILHGSGKDDELINAVVIDRMIYYLTGLCHIRWAP